MPLIKDWSDKEVNEDTDEYANWLLNDEYYYDASKRIRSAAAMKDLFDGFYVEGFNKSNVRWGYLVWVRREE